MKKEYKDLELETVKFETEDVITASGGCDPDKICLGLDCNPFQTVCEAIGCRLDGCMDVACPVF